MLAEEELVAGDLVLCVALWAPKSGWGASDALLGLVRRLRPSIHPSMHAAIHQACMWVRASA